MKIKKNFLVLAFTIGFLMFATALPTFADSTVVVTAPSLATGMPDVVAHPTKWFFYNDQTDVIDNTLGSFVTGPGTAPYSFGSAQISVTGSQRRNLATYQFSGTHLADITVLKFSTYNPSVGNGGGSNRSGYLNFNVDFNGTDSWQRRLVYVPSQNGTVTQNVWKEWDAINGGNAMWSYSGATWPTATAGPDNGVIGISGTTLRKWSDILADYPGIRIRVTDSWLGIRVGEPYADGYTENIDGFKFGTAVGTTTYDFDPYVAPPTLISQCKNNGWQTFNDPHFANQGDCVSYVRAHSHSVLGNVRYIAYGLSRSAQFAADTADGGGAFQYTDANHAWYRVLIASLSVSGHEAWFAGRVWQASNPSWVGNWLFAKVKDSSPKSIWGSFTTQVAALSGVSAMSTPADGPFNTIGALVVH